MPNIEIDLTKFLDLNISLNQYIFIKSLYPNKYKGIKSFVNTYVSDKDITDLIEKGYLSKGSTKESSNLSNEWYEQTSSVYSDDWFKSFHERYPSSVLRPDGTKDYLRVNLNKCRSLYKDIVKDNYEMHLRLCKALEKEVEIKRKANKMGYFRRLDNWLRNEVWLESEAIEDDKQLINMSYGTEIE